ncbi:hypothetical protein J4Q44_G00021210 [Coregonus suidteri]|uniref:Uncharacterized protein n=1 Tax=Coregonus suidteri TaxID=861788 RepID=A0AAN8NFM8_9TELE
MDIDHKTRQLICIHYPRHSLKIPPKRKKRSTPNIGFYSHVYNYYPEGLGAALRREPFDFNAEPPWDPS